MSALPSRTADSLPERIRAASRRPKTLGGAVPGAISLAMGEPDSNTPQPVVEAAVRALRAGRTRYSQITGSPDLRQEIASHLARFQGLGIDPANVVVTHGGSAGLAATVLALLNPGDRVLLPEPTYSLYADHAAMAGAKVEWISTRPDGSIDLHKLAAAAPGARMLILCNPVNPTGMVFSKADIEGVGAILRDHPDLYLLSDEAYSDIVFDGIAFTSASELISVRDRVLLSGTFSKSYSMTGWRIGFICAAAAVAEKINLVHRTINGPLNTFVQDAAVEALRIPDKDLHALSARFQHRRDLVMRHLDGLDAVSVVRPLGAFYAFPRIDSALSSVELVQRFADGGVLVRAGSEFGPSGEGHVRLSFATDEAALEEGLRRFTHVINAL
ncbi:pyridoxal phosphate-dependent aminotransferase [Streptomyces caniscabiei]|nr:pyridoxal phosphate-dependent aminotransferase [Streptomyces caniscabiei]MBE4739729.1 pyridoxal phosphate-dependent aminotransferase [Streptomyces caniscabiei]MBE4760339.1 pyridoxal phosphate-dependent aminotransferase [Streptomyces caniscabiei]MBE4773715.1 pyridoxal phosphate-dependent aminotransferase [Streptomyces caniscabiei]MBE4782591.1 pyridoxal phosphate-dependent aminotransferase [Streptomyces caniscabiei]MBE4791894.1 pyridoxal phosphate-dependent aminotransferase [Streptomyces cani